MALEVAAKIGLETQVNTTVAHHNVNHLREITQIVSDAGSRLWSVFFLVVTGRAQLEDDLTAEEYEQVFDFLYRAPAFMRRSDIKTTRSPALSPVLCAAEEAHGPERGKRLQLRSSSGTLESMTERACCLCPTPANFPSGSLDFRRQRPHAHFADAYRNSQLFQIIRKPEHYEGKCGVCEYRNMCGGSRSRALALTGNHLGSDPRCVTSLPPLQKPIQSCLSQSRH